MLRINYTDIIALKTKKERGDEISVNLNLNTSLQLYDGGMAIPPYDRVHSKRSFNSKVGCDCTPTT